MSFVHQFEFNAELPVLSGHRVQGRCVLPGLAYIDLLYQSFAEQVEQIDRLVVRNLSIYSPLMLETAQTLALELEWSQSSPDVWSVVVQGAGSAAPGRVRYAAAEMHVSAAAGSIKHATPLDLAALLRRAKRVADVGELYARCRARGLQHDGYMRALGSVWRDDEALYAELSLDDAAVDQSGEAWLHPALLDAAAVTLGLASQDEVGDTELFLPLFFDAFESRAVLPSRCWVRARRDSIRQRHELRYLTLEFFDESGRPIAQLSNLTAKLLRAEGRDVERDDQTRPEHHSDQAVPTTSTRAVERYLREQIGRQLGCAASTIGTEVGYYELGLTSAGLMELGMSLSRKVGVDLPPTLMFEYPTLRELADHLAGRFGDRFAGSLGEPPQGSASIAAPGLAAAPQRRLPETSAGATPALQEPIAIIGMEGRFAGAPDLAALWTVLRDGVDCISDIPADRWPAAHCFDGEKGRFGKTYSRWGGFIDDVGAFDPLFFGISPREAQVMDPQCRLFLQTVWTLLEAGGHTRESLQRQYKGQVGVYVGAMYQHYASLDHDADWDAVASLNSFSAIANRVSHFFGFQGPSLAIDTMCSSSAMALHQACKDLASGECALAIAGGVNLTIHPKKYIGLSQAQLLGSHPGSRSFADGDGYLPSEGVAAVLLKPLSRALADGDTIMAVIRASAVVHGGRAQAYMAPNLAAQAEVMQRALERAGLGPADVSYVESAANGSALGDPIEVAALARVWSTAPGARCALGSVKSNLGHPEAVSGMAQLAKVVLQMQHGAIAPWVNAYPLNPQLRLDETPFELQREAAPWRTSPAGDQGVAAPKRALINSFAAGGSYVCLVVEEAPRATPVPATQVEGDDASDQIVVCSARTVERLREQVRRLHDHVQSDPALSLATCAYTLQVGREALPVRFAAVARSREQLLGVLREYLDAGQTETCLDDSPMASYYCADIDVAGPRLRQLLGSEQLAELVAALTVREDWHRVAALWVQGAPVPWHTWPRAAGLRMLRLPTYPFAGDRYWLPGSPAMPVSDASGVPVVRAPVPTEQPLNERIESEIAHFLEQTLSVSPSQFAAQRPLRDYGLDSITGMQLGRQLSARFGVSVTARAMLEHPSAAALARHLTSLCAKPESSDRVLIAALEQFQRGELAMPDIKGLIERSLAV